MFHRLDRCSSVYSLKFRVKVTVRNEYSEHYSSSPRFYNENITSERMKYF